MNDAAAVRVRQRIGDVDAVPQRLADRQRPLKGQPRRKRLPVHVFHGDEGAARVLSDFVHRADRVMVQRRGASGLAQQLIPRNRTLGVGVQHLEGQRPLECRVVGAENRTHAPGAEERVYPEAAEVAAGSEGGMDPWDVGHRKGESNRGNRPGSA